MRVNTITTMSLDEILAMDGVYHDRDGDLDHADWDACIVKGMKELVKEGNIELEYTEIDSDGDYRYDCPISDKSYAWPRQAVVSYD